jgi:hypothetical protein
MKFCYKNFKNNATIKQEFAKKEYLKGLVWPKLFLIYISDLLLCTNLESLLFADNMTVLVSDKTLTLITKEKTEFVKLTQYLRANRLSFNPDETKLIFYTNSLRAQNMDICLFTNDNSSGPPNADLNITLNGKNFSKIKHSFL